MGVSVLKEKKGVEIYEAKNNQDRHVRIPAFACPIVYGRFNIRELEDWIIAGFYVQLLKLGNKEPCVSHIARVSGRSHRKVKASLWRLAQAKEIGLARVRNEFAAGQYGYRWRIWAVSGSNVQRMITGGADPWIAVPASIASYKSTLATAVYMVVAQQVRIDGAATTRPSDLAALLYCDRSTARRLLRLIGCKEVVKSKGGRDVYDLNLPFDRSSFHSFKIGEDFYSVSVPKDKKLREVFEARFNELNYSLEAAGVCVEKAYEDAIALCIEANGESGVSGKCLIRTVEALNYRQLGSVDSYRQRLFSRIGYRLSAFRPRLAARIEARKIDARSEHIQQKREYAQLAAKSALSGICSDCRDGYTYEMIDGYEISSRCKTCNRS